MRNQDGDGPPVRAEFRGLPAVPGIQAVTGLIPHEPSNFQTPAALVSLSHAVCVVTGPRGVGKTQVAAAYARQRARDGWLVAWIGAETEDRIRAGMVELADRLSLYRPEDSTEITAARVRNHLQTRPGPALLVFDNVVSLDGIRSHLPSVGAAQVVVTTTVRGSQLGHEVPVSVFSPEAALEYLRTAIGRDDVNAAELAQEVGHLPLALAQAAAQIRDARWDCARYLENFRKFPAMTHLSRWDGDPHPLGAATAILMALEPFRSSELVSLLSVLSPEGVSRQMLGDSADDELVRLHRASLVEFAGDSSVVMHRLVQRVIRDRAQESGDLTAVLHAARVVHQRTSLVGEPWADRHLGNEIVRQVEALWAAAHRTDVPAVFELMCLIRLWAISFLRESSDDVRAAPMAEDLHAVCVARHGTDHRLTRIARHGIHKAMGTQPDNIIELLENDLAAFTDEVGAEHPNSLHAAGLLAHHYRKANRYDDAIAVLERALTPWADRPHDTVDVLLLTQALGITYTDAGRAEDAVAVLERTVRNKVSLLGAESSPAIVTMSLLADAYIAMRRLDEARRMCAQVCAVNTRVRGGDHPLTLLSILKFGIALLECGETAQARELIESTHASAAAILGVDHPAATLASALLATIQRD